MRMVLTALLAGCFFIARAENLEGVTFASIPTKVFVPLREISPLLGWEIEWVEEGGKIILAGKELDKKHIKLLFDGTKCLDLAACRERGAEIEISEGGDTFTVASGEKSVTIYIPEHETEVSTKYQELRGWQGNRLVMRTHISTGRGGATPHGSFSAGPKIRHKTSRKYNNAPMPWAVQVYGDIFIHGSSSVPNYPASHGCVRMPYTGKNAARYFFEWVNSGSSVKIVREWSEDAARFNEKKESEDGTKS